MAGLFLNVLNMSIAASWIVLAVVLLRRVLKNAPKWINCVLWGIVALRLLFPFSLMSVFSLIPSVETILQSPDSPRLHIESGFTLVDNSVNHYLQETYYESVINSVNNFVDITVVVSIIWLAGIFALVIYSVLSYVRLKNKVSTAVVLKDNIYQCETVVTPFVLGLVRPRIYLPFDMAEEDMEHVLAHEQAHIKRKDHWWKPLGFFILTVHWFNPLMWLAYTLLCSDIELACDEKVVKTLNQEQRANYSQALLACSLKHHAVAACPIAFAEVNVKNRIKSILTYKKPTRLLMIVGVIVCAIVAVCFLTNPIEADFDTSPNTFTIYEGKELEIKVNYKLIGKETYTVYNHSSEEVYTGNPFFLQMKSHGEWINLHYRKAIGFTMESHTILANDSMEYSTDLAFMYDKLPAGKYRIVKEVELNGINYYVAGEFRSLVSKITPRISKREAVEIVQSLYTDRQKAEFSNFENPIIEKVVLKTNPSTGFMGEEQDVTGKKLYKITFQTKHGEWVKSDVWYLDRRNGYIVGKDFKW